MAVPLGPWAEFRRKRPVLITADLARCAALLTIPAAYALGALTFLQLLLVSVVAAADITFRAASGAYLKTLLPPEDLLPELASYRGSTTRLHPRPGRPEVGGQFRGRPAAVAGGRTLAGVRRAPQPRAWPAPGGHPPTAADPGGRVAP